MAALNSYQMIYLNDIRKQLEIVERYDAAILENGVPSLSQAEYTEALDSACAIDGVEWLCRQLSRINADLEQTEKELKLEKDAGLIGQQMINKLRKENEELTKRLAEESPWF